MEAPLVSVCIANYNGENIIESCVDSVLSQATSHAVEIIIHDDGSTDGSVALIKAKYPFVRLMGDKNNHGYCVSNNRMAEVANGQYILLLNNDAMLFDDAIESLASFALNHDKEAILSLPQYEASSGGIVDCGADLDLFVNPVHYKSVKEREVALVAGACFWVSKATWLDVGGFPSWFGSLAEDAYFCCYARLMGYRVIALGHSGYKHEVGYSFGGGKLKGTVLNTTYRRRRLSETNKFRVMFACFPSPLMYVLLLFHLVLLLLEGAGLCVVKFSVEPFLQIYLPALKRFFVDIPNLLSRRALNQSRRTCGIIRYYQVIRFFPHKLKLLYRYGIPEVR